MKWPQIQKLTFQRYFSKRAIPGTKHIQTETGALPVKRIYSIETRVRVLSFSRLLKTSQFYKNCLKKEW
jgi:hypothetical protein